MADYSIIFGISIRVMIVGKPKSTEKIPLGINLISLKFTTVDLADGSSENQISINNLPLYVVDIKIP